MLYVHTTVYCMYSIVLRVLNGDDDDVYILHYTTN